MFEGAWVLVLTGIAAVRLALVVIRCARWRRFPPHRPIALGAAAETMARVRLLQPRYVPLALRASLWRERRP
jgi:hypothetical protein